MILKLLNYCFEERIWFDVKASFASRPLSHLIWWYNKPGDLAKKFWEEAIQFHGTCHGLKITNCWERSIIWNIALLMTPKMSLILGQKLPIYKKGHITRRNWGLKNAKKHIRLTRKIEPEYLFDLSPIV